MVFVKKISYIHEEDKLRKDDEYLDILIELTDGNIYSSTVVTPTYMMRFMGNEKQNKFGSRGVCYQNDSDILIVSETSEKTIEAAVKYIVEDQCNLSQFTKVLSEEEGL